MKKYLVIVECAIELNDKFLIIKRPFGVHAGGLLAFPGGKVEEVDEIYNEDILRAAVKREVFEEVGLLLEDPINYITSTYFVDSSGTHVIDSIFYCKLEKTLPEVKPSPREVPEYYWLNAEQLMNDENSPGWMKQYIQKIENYRK